MEAEPEKSPERSLRSRLKSQIRRQPEDSTTSILSMSSDDGQASGDLLSPASTFSDERRRNSGMSASNLRPPGLASPDRRGSSDSGRRLSRLVRKTSRRKKAREAGLIPGTEFSGVRNSSKDSRDALGILNKKLELADSANASTDSVAAKNNSGGSSLLTEDDDSEDSAVRPPLESRPSHTEYLTFSSPLVTAETVDVADARNGREPNDSLAESSTQQYENPQLVESPESLKSSDSAAERKRTGTFQRPETSQSTKPSLVSISTTSIGSVPPETVITPPTPLIDRKDDLSSDANGTSKHRRGTASIGSIITEPPTAALSGDAASHRRVKSTAGARTASGHMTVLTPTIEELRAPNGTSGHGGSAGGFFSSMFSATSNAVSQISNTFTNPATFGGNRKAGSAANGTGHQRIASSPAAVDAGAISSDNGNAQDTEEDQPEAEQAIKTLGKGNLSLSHLGISEASLADSVEATSRTDRSDETSATNPAKRQSSVLRTDEASVADAISSAYAADTPRPPDTDTVPIIEDTIGNDAGRPRSLGSMGTVAADGGAVNTSKDSEALATIPANRQGSVRSRISGKKRKPRGGSAPTGGTIAAALGQSHAAVANPGILASGRRPTGFAVASNKRNRDFHNLFKSIPLDDFLIDDYSAALQREILLHGRLYVSERHICFFSNIFGWITNLVISFDEVVSLAKKSTAVVFPNAIVIQTLQSRNVFASFMNRDNTYDLLVGIWRVGHPNLKPSENGHMLDESANAANANTVAEGNESSDEDDESSDEDEEDEDGQGDGADDGDRSGNEHASGAIENEGADLPRMASVAGRTATMGTIGLPQRKVTDANDASPLTSPGTRAAADFPGPATHAPTECSDQSTHYDKQSLDTVIAAPLGRVYSILFGPLSGHMMAKFLADVQKCTDIHMVDDKKGMDNNIRTFSYDYIKPLNAPIGPKQTKCIVNQTLDAFDLEKAVSVTMATQSPDVPSGNSFVVKTRYCLTWAPNNSTRINMNTTMEWSAKSWLKTPIEKGTWEGQSQHGAELADFLKQQVATKPLAKAPKGKVKGKKKRSAAESPSPDAVSEKAVVPPPTPKPVASWGPLEPLHVVVDTIGSMLGQELSVRNVLLVLLTTLVIRHFWYGSGVAIKQPGAGSGITHTDPAVRLASYEQLWQQEETQLWDWLEDRIRADSHTSTSAGSARKDERGAGANAFEESTHERMNERQIDDAIRITENRLYELKAVVEKRKNEKKG